MNIASASLSDGSRVLRRGFLLAAALLLVGASSGLATQPVDVVFVLDNSGSMKANDPEFLTRRAVKDFVDALAAEDALDGRIAIVLFDDRVRLGQPLTPASDVASTRRLDATLAALDYSGQRTDSPAGIERALYELRERGRADARRAIVFLTDGRIDTGDARRDEDVARWLREDLAGESADGDVRIFGIAFTEAADYQLMQALALRTSASYYRAFAPGELGSVVEDVLSKLAAAPVYERAFVDPPQTAPAPTPAASSPDVAAAPFPPGDEDDAGPGLLAWIPALLFLLGAGYFVARRRHAPDVAEPRVPVAQLLDLGGQLGDAGRSLPLGPKRTTIGRDPNNDLVLDDDTISSEHAAIEVRDGRYWLEDLRSTNGTRLADRLLAEGEQRPLKGGDHVRLADVDLMFVVEGYVPGGATVYLSSSTTPPADWPALADAQAPDSAPPIEPSVFGEAPPADAPRVAPAPEVPSGERSFAEQRERLDPAEVVDLDERLGEPAAGEVADEEIEDAAPTPSQTAVERAEAALEAIEPPPEPRPTGRPALALVTTPPIAEPEEALPSAEAGKALPSESPEEAASFPPEEITVPGGEASPEEAATPDEITTPSLVAVVPDADAEATEVFEEEATTPEGEPVPPVDSIATTDDPDATAEVKAPSVALAEEPTLPPVENDTPEAPDAPALATCLDYHLARVSEISPAFRQFVDRAFPEDLRQALPITALEVVNAAGTSGRAELRPYTRDRVRYVVCGVPGAMPEARDRFVEDFGGFTRVLTEQLQDESFSRDRCEILALLTCGFDGQPWVSLSIVPQEGRDPRIDLLSYEFLTDAERHEIEPQIDPEISQSGLA